MKTRRSCKRSLAHTTLSNDATVRAPSDNTLTNSQRSFGIAVHRLSAVTSICPLVDCAPLRHIWVGTYGSSSSVFLFEPHRRGAVPGILLTSKRSSEATNLEL